MEIRLLYLAVTRGHFSEILDAEFIIGVDTAKSKGGIHQIRDFLVVTITSLLLFGEGFQR